MTLPRRLAEYNTPEGAREYLEEYEKMHRKLSDRRERRILDGFFDVMGPLDSALDLPSGWGRYLPYLREHCATVAQADYSIEMLRLGAELRPEPAPLGRFRAAGHRIPVADEAFDLVFSMRLSHHLADPDVRRGHVDEVLRTARRYAVFSYFDHATLKNRLRNLKLRLGRAKRRKNALRRAEVARQVERAGFEILRTPLLFLLGSGHRLVLARRLTHAGKGGGCATNGAQG